MANLAFLLIFSVQSQASENIARVVGGHAGEQSKIHFHTIIQDVFSCLYSRPMAVSGRHVFP